MLHHLLQGFFQQAHEVAPVTILYKSDSERTNSENGFLKLTNPERSRPEVGIQGLGSLPDPPPPHCVIDSPAELTSEEAATCYVLRLRHYSRRGDARMAKTLPLPLAS